MIRYRIRNHHVINFLSIPAESVPFPHELFEVGRTLTAAEQTEKLYWERNAHRMCINIIVDKYITQLQRFRQEMALPPLPKNFWTLHYPALNPERCYLFRSKMWHAVRRGHSSVLQ